MHAGNEIIGLSIKKLTDIHSKWHNHNLANIYIYMRVESQVVGGRAGEGVKGEGAGVMKDDEDGTWYVDI